MIRHRARLEILAGDLESRYGKDEPLVLEVRAAIPKENKPRFVTASSSGLENKHSVRRHPASV